MQPSWAETQAAFAAAMLDAQPPPEDLIECGGFAVHCNNALGGLTEVLQERFPVTCQLVGQEFFRAMARLYVIGHRPRSPLLMHYGDDLPAFIDQFPPASGVPYLSDVARLEAARSQAYHAPESRALLPQMLSSLPLDSLLQMPLKLHPSLRMLRSIYPVADIWAAHQSSSALSPPAHWEAQDVLIVRPDAEVRLHVLEPGGYVFVRALLDGLAVQDAAHAALASEAQFDLGRSAVNLFAIGAVVSWENV